LADENGFLLPELGNCGSFWLAAVESRHAGHALIAAYENERA